ncbi:hypothetical protein K439DRAFT_1618131 [Ramaria rubella]|nr:hypothetical protein K439DRAFT_1618131 [Ramaria rubella]
MSQAQMYDGPLTITDLGPSGDRHNDNNDKESGYSNASVHSHLPVDYHPGLFMFYELVIYHGGTPPTAPLGVIPPAWNTQILTIQYPAQHLMDMSARQSLATLPGGSILYVTPEMQEHCILTKEYRLWSIRATYVTDNSDLMSRKAHMTFVGRLLLQLCQHTLRGMPYNVKIDPSAFLASIKYQDENGDTHSVEPWRSEAWDIVDQHAVSTRIFIPHVAQHKKAHKQDKTFLHLACHKGSSFKDGFHHPKNHQGFNGDSDEGEEEPDIFGDEGINQDNLNIHTGLINVDDESDVDMDAVVYVTSTTDSSEEEIEEPEEHDDNQEIHHEHTTIDPRYASSSRECTPANSRTLTTHQLKETDSLEESHLTPFENFLRYASIQCAHDRLLLDIKRIEGIPAINKDINGSLTIHNAGMYNRTVDTQRNPFEHQTLQMVAGTWLKVKHAKANSAKDNIQEHINRQHAMVAHGFACDWVECACVTEIKAIMTDPSNSRTLWIGQLEIERKDQPPFCEMEPMTATVVGPHTAGGHVPILLDEELSTYVLKETISVITQWLQYPKEKTISAAQGKFVNILTTITNSYDIFLLDATWKACCSPKSELFNNRKIKHISDKQITETCDKFKQLPIAQSGSMEMLAIRDIAKMCLPFGTMIKKSTTDTLVAMVADIIKFLRDLMPITQSLTPHSSHNDLICKVIECPEF